MYMIKKAEIANIAIPSGIRFFRKAVSVMYNIFAFSSTLKITSGAKINKTPNTAEIIPTIKIVTRKISKTSPLSFFFTSKIL